MRTQPVCTGQTPQAGFLGLQSIAPNSIMAWLCNPGIFLLSKSVGNLLEKLFTPG
jgi:hypothetical protein